MRAWEIRESDPYKKKDYEEYDERGGSSMRGMRGSMRSYKDDSFDEGYDCGYHDGYKAAMKEVRYYDKMESK